MPPTPLPPDCRRGPTTAQVFLGLFIVWQLFFLFAANFLTLVNEVRDKQDNESVEQTLAADWKKAIGRLAPGWLEKKGHIHDVLDLLHSVTHRWEELTCQPQYWKLFAPNVGRDVTFVAVEFRWDDVRDSSLTVGRQLGPLMARPMVYKQPRYPS
jgi:hypothetical protein